MAKTSSFYVEVLQSIAADLDEILEDVLLCEDVLTDGAVLRQSPDDLRAASPGDRSTRGLSAGAFAELADFFQYCEGDDDEQFPALPPGITVTDAPAGSRVSAIEDGGNSSSDDDESLRPSLGGGLTLPVEEVIQRSKTSNRSTAVDIPFFIDLPAPGSVEAAAAQLLQRTPSNASASLPRTGSQGSAAQSSVRLSTSLRESDKRTSAVEIIDSYIGSSEPEPSEQAGARPLSTVATDAEIDEAIAFAVASLESAGVPVPETVVPEPAPAPAPTPVQKEVPPVEAIQRAQTFAGQKVKPLLAEATAPSPAARPGGGLSLSFASLPPPPPKPKESKSDKKERKEREKEKSKEKRESKAARRSFKDRLAKSLTGRVRAKKSPTEKLMRYMKKVVTSRQTTEGRTIENFVVTTKEAHEKDPSALCQKIRQFIDGMADYIRTNRKIGINNVLSKFVRDYPNLSEININAIIEGALQKAVIGPLRNTVMRLIAEDLRQRNALESTGNNMRVLARKSQEDAGIAPKYVSALGWTHPTAFLHKMQRTSLPLKKLENLLRTVTAIHATAERSVAAADEGKHAVLGADDFLPIFIYVLALSGIDAPEAESEYMWGLLDPNLLTGEGGYYLTVFTSAVHVLKTYQDEPAPHTHRASANPNRLSRRPKVEDMEGFLRVYFPDDGLRVFKTFPIRPTTTAAEMSRLIERKMRLPLGEYRLVEIRAGAECPLSDEDLPQQRKNQWPANRAANQYQFTFVRR